MGLLSFFKNKANAKRAEAAADQMWQVLVKGCTFEVPAVHSTEYDVTQAVLTLCKKHPEVITKVLQSKSMVLSLGKQAPAKVSELAWQQLNKGGYLPDNQLSPELLFAQHASFQRRNDIDPDEAQAQVLAKERERNAVTVSSVEAK